ncbi:MAG: hypothetical protein R3C58_10880 [Parvularculaceae bacterium]
MKKHIAVAASAALISSCMHDMGQSTPPLGAPPPDPMYEYDARLKVAAETCEAQYSADKQNYLAAVESRIAEIGQPDASRAPLDAFRAEINAAYNAVVQRCKTHMNCLEVQRYDEAKCYIAASDRKDAERRFADLAADLRRIEKDAQRKRKPQPPANVTVTTNVEQTNEQTTDAQTGPRIEDQDVLVLCGDARNLLKEPCRKACDRGCNN